MNEPEVVGTLFPICFNLPQKWTLKLYNQSMFSMIE